MFSREEVLSVVSVALALVLGGCANKVIDASHERALASEPGANAVTAEELGVEAVEDSSFGPIYDLPDGWVSYTVHQSTTKVIESGS